MPIGMRRRGYKQLHAVGGPTVITTFTQSLGSELLANGDFSAWSGDNPTGWSVSGESGSDPAISEVGSGEDHTGVGTGSANWYESSGGFLILAQNVLTNGDYYQIELSPSYVSGAINANDPINTFLETISNAGDVSFTGRAGSTTFQMYTVGTADVTVDTVSIKKITLNTETTFAADGTLQFHFTLPGSPKARQRCGFWYRGNGTLNYWWVYLRRNNGNTAWDVKLDKVVSGTTTTKLNVTGVGTPNALRVVVSGNDHGVYTSDNGGESWTARGSTVTDSDLASNTGLRAIYNNAVTPIELKAS